MLASVVQTKCELPVPRDAAPHVPLAAADCGGGCTGWEGCWDQGQRLRIWLLDYSIQFLAIIADYLLDYHM